MTLKIQVNSYKNDFFPILHWLALCFEADFHTTLYFILYLVCAMYSAHGTDVYTYNNNIDKVYIYHFNKLMRRRNRAGPTYFSELKSLNKKTLKFPKNHQKEGKLKSLLQ